jgi:multidrug efflux pump subunit AcrB
MDEGDKLKLCSEKYDAIVIGENIYRYREKGLQPREAAIQGTLEVLPAVTASVTTTVIAFLPLFFS